MKKELPMPIIVALVVLAVAVGGFFVWKAGQPQASEVTLPDASKMTMDDIAKVKQAEHDADASRARPQ